MKFVSHSTQETREFAKELMHSLEAGEKATILALYGDLGAGKTALSQFLGEALGVKEAIQSPTFLIEKIYELHDKPWKHLVHIDAYRLEKSSELLALGWEEIVSKQENLVIVEWADKVKEIIPDYAYHIVLTHVAENIRQIEVSAP